MNRQLQRGLAISMAAIGAVLAIVGLIGMLRDGGETTTAESTPTPPSTSTTAAPTTSAPTTTTTAPPTTTTLPSETVVEFAVEFNAALQRGDADFVFDRLHPVVLATYDEASCRTTIQERVLLITDYRLAGPVSGPESVDFTVSNRIITVSELFRAPVIFGFQGADVETEGVFALLDREMRWFTDCG